VGFKGWGGVEAVGAVPAVSVAGTGLTMGVVSQRCTSNRSCF